MLKILNIIKMAFKNIRSNKLRSSLTMLGIIIGIASVIVLVGIGTGATSDVQSSVQKLGTNLLTITITSNDQSLKYEQMDEILELYNVSEVAPYKSVSASVNRGTTQTARASIIATTNSYFDIRDVDIENGRKMSLIDMENSSKVCIIGSEISSTLFSLVDPVGQKIKLNGDNYTVIGVLASQRFKYGK